MATRSILASHRKGFRLFWTWKIRHGLVGRPAVSCEVRDLIRRMSRENPLWGSPHIHGELLKLGIEISETSVAKYMVRHRKPPSQTWRTFLDNHVKNLGSVDFFTVPTIRFQVLYIFLVLAHDRRRVVHFNVTAHPIAEWTAHQLREAFPFDQVPRYLLHDRDKIFGGAFRDQVKSQTKPGPMQTMARLTAGHFTSGISIGSPIRRGTSLGANVHAGAILRATYSSLGKPTLRNRPHRRQEGSGGRYNHRIRGPLPG